MKNKLIFFITLSILLFTVLGCSYVDWRKEEANSNKSTTDKAIDSTIGEEKIGIPECDEAFEELAKLVSESETDSFVTKTAKRAFINKIRENLKQKIEENKTDKTKLAKDCREFKTQIDNYKTEDTNTKSEK